jgi:hypothetical protein
LADPVDDAVEALPPDETDGELLSVDGLSIELASAEPDAFSDFFPSFPLLASLVLPDFA